MENKLSLFLEISSQLTGFEVAELQGTGMGPTYLDTIATTTPAETLAQFFEAAAQILQKGAGDEALMNTMIAAELFPLGCFSGLAQNIITMWYTSQWPPAVNASIAKNGIENARNVSPEAYVQGLVWTAANTHPPGAKQPGYGSWASPPVGVQ